MGNATVRGLVYASILAAAVAAGCTKKDKDPQPTPAQAKPAAAATQAATPAGPPAACGAAAKAPGRSGITWFHDDYAGALACADARKLPLVVDLWAPWCHTCLSMKQTVLVDPGLAPMADRFVWLALDTDKEVNAPALAKLPVSTWPTFYVVWPRDETVQARYLGAASVKQFRSFLKQGEAEVSWAASPFSGKRDPVALRMREADQAAVAGDWKRADEGYSTALARAPADWPRRADVLVSKIGAVYRLKDWARCVSFAHDNLDKTGASASAGDFIYYASVCAEKSEDKAAAKAMLTKAVARLTTVVEDATAPLSVDDRSDGLRILRTLHVALGDEDSAKSAATSQRSLLDKASKRAPTPFAAMTYNWPRAEVYVYLGVPGELVADLEKSVKDLPLQYDPPYRLAWIYSKLSKHDDALVMANKALALAYGPRKASVQNLIATLHGAKGDAKAQLAALGEVVKLYEQLPDGQKQPGALERAKEALANAGKTQQE